VSRVVVDLERLAELADRMGRFQSHLMRVMEEVDTRERQLGITWTGAAAAAQFDAHGRWDAGAAEVQQALADLRAIASTAHGNYAAAVSANLRMWAL
jgi:WXG100 family type VII secretion target